MIDVTDIQPSSRRGDRNTKFVIQQRHGLIVQIIDSMHHEGKIVDDILIYEELKKRGYHMSERTFKRDIATINKDNTFVMDLAQSHYSRIVEFCFEQYNDVIRNCMVIENIQWNNDKTIVDEEINEDTGEIEIVRRRTITSRKNIHLPDLERFTSASLQPTSCLNH